MSAVVARGRLRPGVSGAARRPATTAPGLLGGPALFFAGLAAPAAGALSRAAPRFFARRALSFAVGSDGDLHRAPVVSSSHRPEILVSPLGCQVASAIPSVIIVTGRRPC